MGGLTMGHLFVLAVCALIPMALGAGVVLLIVHFLGGHRVR